MTARVYWRWINDSAMAAYAHRGRLYQEEPLVYISTTNPELLQRLVAAANPVLEEFAAPPSRSGTP